MSALRAVLPAAQAEARTAEEREAARLARVKAWADASPPFSPEQIRRLAVLLTPPVASHDPPDAAAVRTVGGDAA